jgi:hypothetical protein
MVGIPPLRYQHWAWWAHFTARPPLRAFADSEGSGMTAVLVEVPQGFIAEPTYAETAEQAD